MNDEATSDVYGPLLECLCSWGKASDVIELIDDRIHNTLQDNLTQKNRTSGKRKTVNFSLPLTKSCVALNFLDWLMTSQSCRTQVFEVGEHLKKLSETLSSSMDIIEGYLNDFSGGKEKGEFLKKALESYCRLRIHLCAKENETGSTSDEILNTSHENIVLAYEQILTWCERVLLSHIDIDSSDNEDELEPKRGRPNQEWQPSEFVILVLKNLLNLFSELVMIGVSKSRLDLPLAHFTSSLVKHEKSFVLLPEISKLMYQIAQEITHLDDDATLDLNPIIIILGNILKSATSFNHPDKLQILTSLRPSLFEILKMFHFNNRYLSVNVDDNLMMIIIEAVIKELVAILKQNPLMTNECSMENLPTTSKIMLDLILKSKFLFRIFVKEINNCITSGKLRDMDYEVTAYLIQIFINDGKFIESMKPCLSEIEKALERLEAEHQEIPQYIVEAKRLVADSYKKIEVDL